ncbi:iron-containing alcohol dehydrogenase [candidate division KSB3 bacterium]|uniref:Iron-containing alcohol dehydrogenase n=1 Tax=candidate division KSB3 bacterium TaxID=2044937 RepID=A0A9D5Q653_9BACT|nr:iron-containing alcohol dehydrogenase [candidate division KSB3 bacterium]MBD3325048.1 iron-containing alcohol dehydrogenase [candidate division KSB3 bacterium]
MMNKPNIQQALQAASETEDFILDEGCRRQTPAVFQRYFPGMKALVVADETTFDVAGKSVHDHLQAAQIETLEPFVFPGYPTLHAEYANIEQLRDFLKDQPDTIPIAVGSGTINDIVKRGSYECDRRYMVVATAASMDGYSSFGAAIVRDGFKKTLECPAPLVIIADIEILRDAPPEMTAAGYGDLVSKIPAGADWVIADAVGVDPFVPAVWEMVQPDLRKWIAAPDKLKTGDSQAFEYLFEGLTMTGFAMQALRRSRPASGADHLFSHMWEMQNLTGSQGETISHGFKVSIGILASTALMEVVCAREIRQQDIDAVCRAWKPWEARKADIQQAFQDTPIIDRVLAESQAKYLSVEQLRQRLKSLRTRWQELCDHVTRQLIPYPELKQMFIAAGCPVTPEQINLTRDRVCHTVAPAQMIRNRYTILDLAYELGWLEACVEEIKHSEIYLC